MYISKLGYDRSFVVSRNRYLRSTPQSITVYHKSAIEYRSAREKAFSSLTMLPSTGIACLLGYSHQLKESASMQAGWSSRVHPGTLIECPGFCCGVSPKIWCHSSLPVSAGTSGSGNAGRFSSTAWIMTTFDRGYWASNSPANKSTATTTNHQWDTVPPLSSKEAGEWRQTSDGTWSAIDFVIQCWIGCHAENSLEPARVYLDTYPVVPFSKPSDCMIPTLASIQSQVTIFSSIRL
ncbi:hypothetical protein BJ170DRAFT_189238 [Xylariales sp. AK1849]|nr:hypothetical protein BJ170DRAFT_189238 [Xylariales sp. AK1849]